MTTDDQVELLRVLRSDKVVRVVGRRYRIAPQSSSGGGSMISQRAPEHFPPGFVSSLFHDVCSLVRDHDGVDIRSNYMRLQAMDRRCASAVITVFVVVVDDVSLSCFDVIVCGTDTGHHDDDRDHDDRDGAGGGGDFSISSVWCIAQAISRVVMGSRDCHRQHIMLDEFGLRDKRDATGSFENIICDSQMPPLSQCTRYILRHELLLLSALMGRRRHSDQRHRNANDVNMMLSSALVKEMMRTAVMAQLRQLARAVGVSSVIASAAEWLSANDVDEVLRERREMASEMFDEGSSSWRAFEEDLSRLCDGLKVCAEAEECVVTALMSAHSDGGGIASSYTSSSSTSTLSSLSIDCLITSGLISGDNDDDEVEAASCEQRLLQ